MEWHRFAPSSDDDQDCTRPGCGLSVTDDALPLIDHPCPAPACTDPGNPGPCVVARVADRAECSYCALVLTAGCG